MTSISNDNIDISNRFGVNNMFAADGGDFIIDLKFIVVGTSKNIQLEELANWKMEIVVW